MCAECYCKDMRRVPCFNNELRPLHVPCKHVCACILAFAAAVDENPEVLFRIRVPYPEPQEERDEQPRTAGASSEAPVYDLTGDNTSEVIDFTVEGSTESQAIEVYDSDGSDVWTWSQGSLLVD